MNLFHSSHTAFIILLSAVLSAGLLFQACTSTADIAEVNHTTLPSEEQEVFRATLQALDNIGFGISRMDADNGKIEAVFVNRGSDNEGRFFGYTSNTAQRVKAEIELLEAGGETRLNLNLFEVYPPSDSQYGTFSTEDSEHLLRRTRYYEGIIGAIRDELNLEESEEVTLRPQSEAPAAGS